MVKMISFCGLDCSVCPALVAMTTNDNGLRAKTATEWSAQFRADIKAEHINCSGCTSTTGTVFNHCRVCEMRKCGQERGLANCGACDDFATCDKLAAFHKMVPDARANLEALRSSR